jgi:hypothetical protein
MSANDPRSSLAAYAGSTTAQTFAAAEYARFYDMPPQVDTSLLKLWYARGQNFVIGYADALTGAEFSRLDQPDEYVVLIPDATVELVIEWKDKSHTVPGPSIAFVPAGASSVKVIKPGRFIVMLTSRSADLCEQCVNAESYAQPHPNIPPFEAWPEPVEGPKVRAYSLDVPDEEGRFGRIWRCTTFMINFVPPQQGPRDVTKLSPHHHDNFEQGSFALDGAFTHHVRWPWTSDLNAWREDDHEYCGSPSLAVIPPPAIHTSRGMAVGLNQLIDIFSPPRVDFSLKEGWVLNAGEYPMPIKKA